MSKENDYQGQPVAWLARAVDADGTTYRQCVSTNELTERDAKFAWGEGVMNRCSVVITPLGPIADPAEVERLRNEHTEAVNVGMRYQDQCKALCAQLAEAHALQPKLIDLLKRLLDNPHTFRRHICNNEEICGLINALSASAEPSYENKGIKGHDGQKLLVQHILDNDKGLSDSSRVILEKLIE